MTGEVYDRSCFYERDKFSGLLTIHYLRFYVKVIVDRWTDRQTLQSAVRQTNAAHYIILLGADNDDEPCCLI